MMKMIDGWKKGKGMKRSKANRQCKTSGKKIGISRQNSRDEGRKAKGMKTPRCCRHDFMNFVFDSCSFLGRSFQNNVGIMSKGIPFFCKNKEKSTISGKRWVRREGVK